MKKNLYIALLLGAASVSAQQVEKTDTLQGRDVTIEREFTPILQDANKIYSLPSVKTVEVSKDPVKYTYYSTTVTPDLATKPLASANINFHKPDFYNGYARLGIGHNITTIGDFGYKIDNGERSCFDINVHHLGNFGHKQYSNTAVGFTFQQQVKKVVLYGDLDASHQWFNYYGRYYNDTLKSHYDRDAMKDDSTDTYHNRVWNVDFHLGVRSLADAKTRFFGELGYELTNVKGVTGYAVNGTGDEHYPMSEHRIHARGGASWKLGKGRIGFDADARVLLYTSNPLDMDLDPDAHETSTDHSARGLIHLQPFYELTGRKAWLHAGLNMDLDLSDQAYFRVSPCIQTEWQAMPELFSIYANVNGRYDAPTYKSELERNRYADPLHLFHIEKQPYTPVDAEVGFKIKPIEQLQVNVYGRYAYTFHQRYNVAEMLAGQFNGLFRDTTANEQHAAVGFSVNFNWKENIRIFTDLHYNYFKADGMQYAWDRAKLEAQLGANYKINQHWAVQLDSYFATKRYALMQDGTAQKLNAIYDINLGCTYTLNRYVSFFLNINNIANCKHEYLYGYENNGINGLIGAAFQF